MKGLLIKDFKLMSREISILNVVLTAVVLTVLIIADVDSYSFIYSGLSGMSVVAAVSSVGVRNCDVCDNGLTYLLTLPVSRREYVREIYLFSCLSACTAMLVYCFFNRIPTIIFPSDGVYDSFDIFYRIVWDSFKNVLLVIALLIPFYLLFGSKKRNQYVLIAVGIIVVITFYEGMSLCVAIEKGVKLLKEFPVTLIALAVSYVLSVIIMERKDL